MAARNGSNATVWDVAEAAGVSAQTVSRALRNRGYVSAATRERVLAAAERLDYSPNLLGKSLRSTRTPMVGLVVADVTNPFYARLHRALEAPLREAGLSVLLLNCDDDPEIERRQLELLASYQPTGVVLVPAHDSRVTANQLARFDSAVLVSRTLAGVDVPTVVFDEAAAFEEATEELCDAGHRRVVAILGPTGVSTTIHREDGFREAASRRGVDAQVIYTDGTSAGGYAAARDVLAATPGATGIVGFTVPVTEGVLAAVRDAGLAVPADVSLVSFTDATWMASTHPAITAVAQPVEEMGRIAGALLASMSRGERSGHGAHLSGRGTLVRRDSVARFEGQ